MAALGALSAEGATLRGTVGDAQEAVGIRPAPAFSHFAAHLVSAAGALVSPVEPTSAAAVALGAIDSSMAPLGPIFLDHAQTLGAGKWNVNAVAMQSLGDSVLDGQGLDNLGASSGRTILKRTPTGHGPPLEAVRLRYDLDLRLRALAIALSRGLTDDVDVSVLVPVVSSAIDCAVTAGGRSGAVHTGSVGVGDLDVRLKYALPTPKPFYGAATLDAVFPVGDKAQAHGTGDYWLMPAADFSLGNTRLEANVRLGAAVDLSDARQSHAIYGVSGSALLWPRHLAAVVEFLGSSAFVPSLSVPDTQTLVLSHGSVGPGSLLGVDWLDRLDRFNLAFGVRVPLGAHVMAFASGLLPLNRGSGLRPDGITPAVGVGGAW